MPEAATVTIDVTPAKDVRIPFEFLEPARVMQYMADNGYFELLEGRLTRAEFEKRVERVDGHLGKRLVHWAWIAVPLLLVLVFKVALAWIYFSNRNEPAFPHGLFWSLFGVLVVLVVGANVVVHNRVRGAMRERLDVVVAELNGVDGPNGITWSYLLGRPSTVILKLE